MLNALNARTALHKALNMHLQQVSLVVRFQELIGCMFVTFGSAPGSSAADSLDGAYFGPFRHVRKLSLTFANFRHITLAVTILKMNFPIGVNR